MTEHPILWSPVFAPAIIIVASLALLAVLLYVETRRPFRFKVLRMVAQSVFVVALALLLLRPAVATDKKHGSILLLTNGYDAGTARELLEQDGGLRPVTVPGVAPYKNSSTLASINDLPAIAAEVEHVAGEGLPSWVLEMMPDRSFAFHPTAEAGLTKLDVPDHLVARRWNTISGSYALDSGAVVLKLRGPGGWEDSVRLTGPGNIPFSLSFFSKTAGRFSYELITPASKEVLPLAIEDERLLSIVMLTDYPTFEVRYLKNFLSSRGHRLAFRSQLSRKQYRFEFVNRAAIGLSSLTNDLLRESDLLLIDERAWQSLTVAEQKNVQSAVTDGMGVVLLPEGTSDKQLRLLPFGRIQASDTLSVALGRAGVAHLPALPLAVAEPARPLTRSTDGRTVAGYLESGFGKVGYQLLTETYRTGLQGNIDAYAAIWVPLIEKCARPTKDDFDIQVVSPFPYYEDEPIDIRIVGSAKEPRLRIDDFAFPVSEDLRVDDLWHARVWLEGNRWHRLAIDSIQRYVYVSGKGQWRELAGNRYSRETALAVEESTDDQSMQVAYNDEAIKYTLFALLLIAAGFTWLSPKL